MKLVIIIMMLLSVRIAVAQVGADSPAKQLPDSSSNWSGKKLRECQLLHPRIESDGVVIGNTKYFIMIYKTDPSIDYKMLRGLPDPRDFDRMPEAPLRHFDPSPHEMHPFKCK